MWLDRECDELNGLDERLTWKEQIRVADSLGTDVPELVWDLHWDKWADCCDAMDVPRAPEEAEQGAGGEGRAVPIYIVNVLIDALLHLAIMHSLRHLSRQLNGFGKTRSPNPPPVSARHGRPTSLLCPCPPAPRPEPSHLIRLVRLVCSKLSAAWAALRSRPDSSRPLPFDSPRRSHFGAKTLVLDLDETLIHSTSRPIPSRTSFFPTTTIPSPAHTVDVILAGRHTQYHVYKRPFVDFFLRTVRPPSPPCFSLLIFITGLRMVYSCHIHSIHERICRSRYRLARCRPRHPCPATFPRRMFFPPSPPSNASVSLPSPAPSYPTVHTQKIYPLSNRIFLGSASSTTPPSATTSIKVRSPPSPTTPLTALSQPTESPSRAGPMIPPTKLY